MSTGILVSRSQTLREGRQVVPFFSRGNHRRTPSRSYPDQPRPDKCANYSRKLIELAKPRTSGLLWGANDRLRAVKSVAPCTMLASETRKVRGRIEQMLIAFCKRTCNHYKNKCTTGRPRGMCGHRQRASREILGFLVP